MKKVFFEIGLVIAFTLVYFLVPGIRLPLIITFGVLSIWLLPVQLFLSVSFKNWQDELSGRFHHLPTQVYIMEMLTTLFRAKLTQGLADFWVAANAIKARTKIII